MLLIFFSKKKKKNLVEFVANCVPFQKQKHKIILYIGDISLFLSKYLPYKTSREWLI